MATISLGQPRKFLLRPAAGGASIGFPHGRGDLVVMGGTCQRTWRHTVPKVAHAAARGSRSCFARHGVIIEPCLPKQRVVSISSIWKERVQSTSSPGWDRGSDVRWFSAGLARSARPGWSATLPDGRTASWSN